MLADSAIPKVENEQSIFDGMDTTILGIATLAGSTNFSPELTEISHRVEAAISKFDALKPWVVASDLAAGTKATRALIEQVKASSPEAADKDHVLFLLGNKEQEFNEAMNKALGLVMEVLVDPERASEGPASFFAPRETFHVAIPGQRFSLTLSVTNRSPVLLERGEAGIARTQGWEVTEKTPAGDLPVNNSTLRAQFEAKVPDNAEYTRPHWSRANEWRDHIYQINTPQYLHLPFAPPEIFGVFSYEVEGVQFLLSRPVQTVSIDRPWGEQRRLLTVAPAINIAISPRVGVVPSPPRQLRSPLRSPCRTTSKAMRQAKSNCDCQTVGLQRQPSTLHIHARRRSAQLLFKVSLPRAATGADYQMHAVAEYGGREYTEGYRVIAHRDLEPRHLYRPATMDVRGIDVQVAPNLSVGYVMGVGDEVPQSLEQIGVKVTMLGAKRPGQRPP